LAHLSPAHLSLADGRRGLTGVIVDVSAPEGLPGEDIDAIDRDELERRLLEMGFVEGARITLLHEGLIGRDPICVRLNDMRVALRRREARGVIIQPDSPTSQAGAR
jgi:ferrous iron transport protein A